ncbi:SGNH/GDSL hydrolase family protein [Actinomadura sp. HBU206391]|uniref:SGNH/GDSL hydrolase family protein n=1 Tax=Actinomadura sp. HBU206391 TaxID=2731692 RepID=UPI0016504089|nr:SGNH/GDSL hydrolase family protein [Actinomadura sp. HBU206391]MBC6460501.1 SGNH/GDSL hydrolase family protein [Actinomadura sp. HBU206391]
MTGARSAAWLGSLRERLGPRGAALVLIAVMLVVTTVPLVSLPAVRCQVFGSGCAEVGPPSRTDPSAGPLRRLTPVEAATRGRYVALGDSYSSGEGAYVIAPDRAAVNRCHRTSQSYAHEVARTFAFARGSALWACSGATASSVLRGRFGEPPQVDRVEAGTSLVTISIGGNDAGFSRVLAACVLKLPWSGDCQAQGGEIATRMATLRRSLPGVLDRVTARAPSARVVVLGYPRLFSEARGEGLDNISVGDQQWLNARARELNELIRQAARDADDRIVAERGKGSVEFVDAYSGFAGHEVGSADPYVHGLDVDLMAFRAEAHSFHPTAAGYRRLAELVTRQVNAGPGRPLNQYA